MTPKPRRSEVEIEEEELDVAPSPAPVPKLTPREPLGSAPVTRATAPAELRGRMGSGRMARFAIGALLVAIGLGMLFTAFGSIYYGVEYRSGPDPETDEDGSDRLEYEVRIAKWDVRRVDSDGVEEFSEPDNAYKDAPIVGVPLALMRVTSYTGAGLLALALVAAVLHRFGALTLPGPAPVLALVGVVLPSVGLANFAMDIAHSARLQWVGGNLDVVVAFFTLGAQGTRVHDLNMLPGLGFWLHLSGLAAAFVGSLFLFWADIRTFGERAAEFATRVET